MCALPTDPAGEVTEIEVGELTTKLEPAVPAKVAPDAPVKFVPVTVTTVPPVRGPAEGLIAVTLGPPS